MALREKFKLRHVEVVPSDPDGTSSTVGIAEAGAAEIERWLKRSDPIVLAIGTGHTLKAAVDQLPVIECPQHRIVSLTGNIGPDGSAAYYNVIFSMADAIKARALSRCRCRCSSPRLRSANSCMRRRWCARRSISVRRPT